MASSSPTPDSTVSSALIGGASGILGTIGPTAVVVRTRAADRPDWAQGGRVEGALLALSLGEVFGNALIPWLPPRSKGLTWLSRVVFGAASAGVLAATRKHDIATSAVIGGISAGAVARLSTPLRAVAGRLLPDPLVAIAETAIALAWARTATRR